MSIVYVYCLVDLFNLQLWRSGKDPRKPDLLAGIDSLAQAVLRSHTSNSLREITLRFYGGWHDDETGASTSVRNILASAIRNAPRRIGTRIRFEIAEAPLSHPYLTIPGTVRRARLPRLTLVAKSAANCCNFSTCGARHLTDWANGRCPEKDCSVKTEEVIFAKTQKMVDTMLAADAVFIAAEDRADCLVVASDDDDMLPALLTVRHFGKPLVLLTRRSIDRQRYDPILDSQGIRTSRW